MINTARGDRIDDGIDRLGSITVELAVYDDQNS